MKYWFARPGIRQCVVHQLY